MGASVAILARCAHGSGSVAGSAHRVTIGGAPLLTEVDTLVTGCAAPSAERCARVQWLNAGDRVRSGGQGVVLAATAGLCFTSADVRTGPAIVTAA
jgi:hypothetical protein